MSASGSNDEPSAGTPPPRLIEWTGERMVPWTDDAQVVYEHLHRYYFAASLVAGRRVLDVGSGEGYGTALLADEATSAIGIDIDDASIEHSRGRYGSPTLTFEVASALDLSRFEDDSFGAVVCFEVIEHLADHERLIAEMSRVLAHDGILICSTPEVSAYHETAGGENPFHVKELTRPEFERLLGTRFANVRLWGQVQTSGSTMYPLDDAAGRPCDTYYVMRDDGEFRRTDEPQPLYLVAVAGNTGLPTGPGHSSVVDPGLEQLRRTQAELRQMQATLLELGDRHHQTQLALGDQVAAVAALEGTNAYLWGESEKQYEKMQRIESSVSWQLLERGRGLVTTDDGERTAFGRAISTVLRQLGRLFHR